MSALIHHFVVHQIAIKDEKLHLVPRNACVEVTPAIEVLGHQLNHTFSSKPGKGVGAFIEAPESEGADAFKSELASMMKIQEGTMPSAGDFHGFTLSASKTLIKALTDNGTVETGFVIFSLYNYLATDYLMISMLNTKSHVEVDQDLELTSKEHLDLAKMQLAVKIDLTQWQLQPDQNRYISFIKGRMGRKVSDFFMQFIGCEEQVDVKQQNKQLVTTVDQFLASNELDPAEQHQHREEVHSYFKEKIDSGESVSIQELGERLPQSDGAESFMSFTLHAEVPLEAEIQPDPAALKQLAKFTGQGGGVSISFDRKLMGDRIHYDPNTDTLMIKGIPPNLKDQLTRSLK